MGGHRQLPSSWERGGRTVLGTGKGAGGRSAVQLLRPSQDAPDAAMGSVCVQGDQDIGRADGLSLLAGPGGGMGSVGGSFWELGLPAGPGGVSRHLFTCPAPQRSLNLTWVSDGCGHVTQMYTGRSGGRVRGCGRAWVRVHLWLGLCTCMGVGMHVQGA